MVLLSRYLLLRVLFEFQLKKKENRNEEKKENEREESMRETMVGSLEIVNNSIYQKKKKNVNQMMTCSHNFGE